MRGVDVDFVQGAVALGVDTASPHEGQCALDFGSHLLVALSLGTCCHKFLVPSVHAIEVGKATFGEGPQQVERAGRLVVCLHQALGVGDAGFVMRCRVIDHVAAE